MCSTVAICKLRYVFLHDEVYVVRLGGCTPRHLKSRKNIAMNSVRIDKWLWAARFFKTRALAARACELGRIQSNGQSAKPSREVHVGDLLHVRNSGGDFQ